MGFYIVRNEDYVGGYFQEEQNAIAERDRLNALNETYKHQPGVNTKEYVVIPRKFDDEEETE